MNSRMRLLGCVGSRCRVSARFSLLQTCIASGIDGYCYLSALLVDNYIAAIAVLRTQQLK